jgi:S1-C subfamily serine protease
MQEDSGYGPSGYGSQPGGPGPGTGHWAGGDGQPRRPRQGALTHLLVAVLAAGLAAGLVLAFYQPTSSSPRGSLPGGSAAPVPAASPTSGGSVANSSEQQIVTKVEPGLVIINTTLQYDSEAAAGTGMVINPAGLVLTNNHVIEASTKITATVVSTGKTYPAKVIGYDKTGDISLIKLDGASGLRTVPIGNSATVKARASVVAMGNAAGQGSIIPAAGQVTALNQTISASDEGGSASTETLHGMIQVNADIVVGDSGGPLASSAGLVIGMNTAGNNVSFPQQAAAAGFAIPINTALSIARQIAAGHASSTIAIGYPSFIGIFIGSGSSSNPQTQAQQQEQEQQSGFGGFNGFGTPGSTPSCYPSDADLTVPSAIAPVNSGSLVDGTICWSPAASADITGGSVITAVNGQAVGSPDELTSILAKFRPGDTISVTWVSPSGQRTTSSLHLAAGPPQ